MVNDWNDENSVHISTLLEETHNAHKAYLNNPSSESLKKVWHEQRKATQWTLQQLQNQWWTSKAQQIQSFADKYDMHNFYNAVKTIYGPRSYSGCPLRSVDELTLIKDQTGIVQRRGEHFQALLNQKASVDLTVLQELPTLPRIQS